MMRYFFLLSFLLISLPVYSEDSVLSNFETDYCTNYPEGTRDNPSKWKHCCLIHDMFFWAGGTRKERDLADLDLKSCIEETGAATQAKLIYYAVRAGSYSPIKYPDRMWNNGWKDGRKLSPLTHEDIDLIELEINSGHDYISSDIKEYFLQSLRSRLD